MPAFQKWIDQLEVSVTTILIPALEQCGMMMKEESYKAAGYEPETTIIANARFQFLIASSQQHQVPIFELTPEQLEQQGRVLEITQGSQEEFRTLFSQTATRVIAALDAEGS